MEEEEKNGDYQSLQVHNENEDNVVKSAPKPQGKLDAYHEKLKKQILFFQLSPKHLKMDSKIACRGQRKGNENVSSYYT